MKTGRNEPCPCGSGRKYKQCCGAAAPAVAQSPDDLVWRRLRRLLDEHLGELRRFAMDTYGPEGFNEAWLEFSFPVEDEPFDPQSPHLGVFASWFLHFWSPDPNDTQVEDGALHGVEPTRQFLARKGARLDPLLREYFDSCLEAPLGFHEVVRVDPGRGFRLRELITGAEQDVMERSASETAQAGDIFFGQVVRAGGLGMLECCSSFAFPPIAKIEIAERRRALLRGRKRADFRLRDYDFELLEMYREMAEGILDPAIPEFCNTDGEPISPRKVVFDIDSPRGAFEALKHLDPGAEEELLRTAEHDGEGGLSAVRIAWIQQGKGARGMHNTVLGHLRIAGARLIAEVNSEARERRLREIVAAKLGSAARYRATEIQSMEKLLEEARSSPRSAEEAAADRADQALAETPEAKALIDEHMRRHYESWVSERIPVLGNRTPLQAVRSRSGREAVEALVRQLERDGERMRPPLDPGIVRRLRERLGLIEP